MLGSCGKKNSDNSPQGPGIGAPLVKPVVEATSPNFLNSSSFTISSAISGCTQPEGPFPEVLTLTQALKDRFFCPSPTNLLGLIDQVDLMLSELNRRTSLNPNATCLESDPVNYTLNVFGQQMNLKLNCFSQDSDNSNGILFGIEYDENEERGNDIFYILADSGMTRSALKIEILNKEEKFYQVMGFMGIGYLNKNLSVPCQSAWDGCSYGALSFLANNQTNAMELTVTGIGFGFAAAHLRTNGEITFLTGDQDGAGVNNDVVCVLNADGSNSEENCDSLKSFSLVTLARAEAPKVIKLPGDEDDAKWPAANTENIESQGTIVNPLLIINGESEANNLNDLPNTNGLNALAQENNVSQL